MQDLALQVLSLGDLDEVYSFASERLKHQIPDETERAFRSWEARWRREALEHYLKLGWSFIARVEGQAVGFFLAQPLLFFRAQTQTLWVEHIEARDTDVRAALSEVAIKVAREKHFQRVLFGDGRSIDFTKWNQISFADPITEIKTSK